MNHGHCFPMPSHQTPSAMMYEVGAATADITPPVGTPLAGNFRDDYAARGVYRPLTARAFGSLRRGRTMTSRRAIFRMGRFSSSRRGGADSTVAVRGRVRFTRLRLPRRTARIHGQSPGTRRTSGIRSSGVTGASFTRAGTTLIAMRFITSSFGRPGLTAPTREFTTGTTLSIQSGCGRPGRCRNRVG